MSQSLPSAVVQEVVITASDFPDTERRVRFLAFLRGRRSAVLGTCLGGFTRVRLRTSEIRLVGFNEEL